MMETKQKKHGHTPEEKKKEMYDGKQNGEHVDVKPWKNETHIQGNQSYVHTQQAAKEHGQKPRLMTSGEWDKRSVKRGEQKEIVISTPRTSPKGQGEGNLS